MDLMELGIIVLAALMVWLLYKTTRETRAYGSELEKYALRQAPAQNRGEEHIGGHRTRR